MPVRPLSLISQPTVMVIGHESTEDVSVSPTFEVRLSLKTNAQQRSHNRRRCMADTRAVRFNEAANVCYEADKIFKEDTKDLWYNSEEYRAFKVGFVTACQEIIRIEKQNKKNRNSYHNVMERVYRACCCCFPSEAALITKDAKLFEAWVSDTAVSRLGLEKAIVRNIRQDKAARRNQLLGSILEIQASAADCYSCSSAECSEMVARVAHEISEPAVLFANLLAHAQTHSV